MSEEELKRMEDFVNATLKPDKPNEYRLGYEDALRRCYYFVDNLQQENKQLKEELENIKDFNNKLQASKDRLDKDDYNLAHILAELEEWCNDGIKDELIVFDYGTEIIGEPIKIHIASYEMVLDKIQKLKEKYK